MNIVTLLLLIVLSIAVLYTVIIVQVVVLARIYRMRSWWVGAGTFVLLGGRQIFGLIRLPSAIIEAQLKGVMIEHLNNEQWLMVVWGYVIVVGFIVFLDWLRRDLKKIGV